MDRMLELIAGQVHTASVKDPHEAQQNGQALGTHLLLPAIYRPIHHSISIYISIYVNIICV